MKCPKCGEEMEEALIADRGHGSFSIKQQWGSNLQLGGFAGVKNRRDVKTYRCKNCGYLESYAK